MWTNSSNVPSYANYTIVRRDRGRNNDAGLAFLVDKSIAPHQLPMPSADPMEVLAILFDVGQAPLNVVNVYIPPSSS
ncbi:unnamed protein product [Dibothriocephalus latus]|uniref:Uncharacterized protein n=1 Tax=Dibothriocephalus latus TaxID=60516 RepID=A0A3P7MIK9_DIBLA|nr:unnamed protein product [Dibothriocephalus latus]